jgi:hypothetical protein
MLSKIFIKHSDEYLQSMRLRSVMYIILTTLMNLFCWYYIIVFCSVYVHSAVGWLYSSIITLLFRWFVFGLIEPLGLVLIRIVCRYIRGLA